VAFIQASNTLAAITRYFDGHEDTKTLRNCWRIEYSEKANAQYPITNNQFPTALDF
jgi:hypothetical protein